MQFEPGMRISESILLRQIVGEGGMGQIWSGEHVLLGRPVAIKRLASQFTGNVEALQRFAAEARVAARVECVHVTRVFDYAHLPDGTPYMVMELLEGAELYARIRDGRSLSLEETTRLVVQMGAALTSIHELGIVHRDVKPENIFLVPGEAGEFTAKLLDFGIAKGAGRDESDARTTPGTSVLGTPAYMSPEQLENASEVDARADLWSLAVVVYCCLTGTMPFVGNSLAALGHAIRQGVFVPVTERVPELPPALDRWFAGAFAPDIDARFRTAEAMAAAFVEATGTQPTPARAKGAKPRLQLVMTPAPGPAPASPPLAAPHRRWPGALCVLTAVAARAATTVARALPP
jgi:eukaryotic-like serine/threonine-protein kinase